MDPGVLSNKASVLLHQLYNYTSYSLSLIFSDTRGSQFREEHAFIGYQKDTPAAVIFQATTLLRRLVEKPGEAERLHLQRAGVLTDDLSGLFEAGEKSPRWLEAVR